MTKADPTDISQMLERYTKGREVASHMEVLLRLLLSYEIGDIPPPYVFDMANTLVEQERALVTERQVLGKIQNDLVATRNERDDLLRDKAERERKSVER